jgi:hypothetical protein
VTGDLVTFLRDRLDEDEQAARAMPSGPWRWSTVEDGGCEWDKLTGADEQEVLSSGDASSDSSWIRRHEALDAYLHTVDPARVLDEVDAKRKALALYERASADAESPDHLVAMPGRVQCLALEPVFRLLALPYRDHPDYRPEWAPQGS